MSIAYRERGKVHTIHTQHIVWFCLIRTSLVSYSEKKKVYITHTRHMCTLNPEPSTWREERKAVPKSGIDEVRTNV